MLAVPTPTPGVPPPGPEWIHEIKFDGYRMQMRIEAGKAAGIAAPVAENDKRTNFIR